MNESRKTRLAHLLGEMAKRPNHPISTGGARQIYARLNLNAPNRGTARRDLDAAANDGLLHRHGPDDGRFYTLNHAGGAR